MKISGQSKRGIKNKYRPGIPFTEMLIKDIHSVLIEWVNLFRNKGKHKGILFQPDYPSKKSTLYKISRHLAYNISNINRKNNECIIHFENATHREALKLQTAGDRITVINSKSLNISKDYIDKVHKEIFGYCTIINPITYKGKAVQKNLLNAKHDGIIIDCPLKKTEKGYIYQKLIDNTYEGGLVKDIRIPLINYRIPFLYLKYRPQGQRFKNTNSHAELLHDPLEVLTAKELELIIDFAKAIHLDFGEADVLRDKQDGKIYIVDINNTPYGPPNHLPKKDKKLALKLLARTFSKEFLLLK